MNVRDRVKDLRRVRARELRPHPHNWRGHPPQQRDALRGVLAEVGYADALVVRELPDGSLQLIDGHLRAETTPDVAVPVLVVDLDDAETAKVLATHDPLAAMAEVNAPALAGLLESVQTDSEAVAAMLDEMLSGAEAAEFPNEPPPEVGVPETFQVVVECEDEEDQRRLYERMREEGRRCRVLTL